MPVVTSLLFRKPSCRSSKPLEKIWMSFLSKPWRCFITTQRGPAISCNPDDPLIKNAASPEFGGDGFFVGERGIEIRGRLASTFDGAHKPMQAFEAAKLIGVAEPGGIE